MAVPKLQLLSRTQYDTDGTTTVWDFNFSGGYILQDHVKAYYDDAGGIRTTVVVTPAMLIGTWQLQITPAIPAGNVLTIYRATPKDQPMVDFVDRGSISEVALDTLARQAVFVAAEASDDTVTANSDVAVNAAAQAQAAQAAAVAASNNAAASAALADADRVAADASAGAAAASAAAASAAVSAALVDQVGVKSVNGGPLGGFRNLLFNSLFDVNQRGYVSGTATTGANQYTLDRWRVVVSGQSLAFTASGIGNIVTAPAGGIEQVIRGHGIRGGSYVLNWTGTATATVNGTARAKGEVFTLPANTNTTVRLLGGTVQPGVQLEFGNVATSPEYLLLADRLRQCKRFFRKSFDGPLGTAPGDTGAIYSQTNSSAGAIDCVVSVRWDEEMDRVPDVTPRNAQGVWANTNWRASSDAVDVTASVLNANRQGVNIRLFSLAGGQWARGHYTADAEVY